MAYLSGTSSFQSWVLSEAEILQGSILTTSQKQCIQNQIVSLAERKLNITFDPSNPLNFAQQEAELRGSIDALKYLLSLSESAEKEVGSGSIHLST